MVFFLLKWASNAYLSRNESLLNPFIFRTCLHRNRIHTSLSAEVSCVQPVLFNALQAGVFPWEEISVEEVQTPQVWKSKCINSKEFVIAYPLPSGARSWITRWAHRFGTGGSKILPFGNWAKHTLRIEAKTTKDFIMSLIWEKRENQKIV